MAESARLTTLERICRGIDLVNDRIGRAVAWMALAMVLVQFIVVVLRYVFGVGSLFLQESIVYLHGTMFMVGAGYTLLHGHHVRVDVFYRGASARWKACVDLAGVVFFLVPVCVIIWIFSWPYVTKSWRVVEGSIESSGIPAVFLLKTVLLAFSVLMILQGVSLALKSVLRLAGVIPPEPPGETADPDAAVVARDSR